MSIQTERFKRADRLVRPEEFAYVLRHGRRVGAGAFVVMVAERWEQGPQPGARLGITVSRRVGNAVLRNRLKRRIREWFRRRPGRTERNLDVVVVGRPAGARLSQRAVARALEEGVRAAGGGV